MSGPWSARGAAAAGMVVAALALASDDAAAQRGGRGAGTIPPALAPVLESIRAHNDWTLAQQVSVCEIPAPPFKEGARAAEVKRRFEALGLARVRIDSVGNVIGERAGTGGGPTVVLAGHLDTVFPEGTDVHVRHEGNRLAAPGIGDDCRGLAVLLSVARALGESKVQTPGTIVFVADVGEEGAGNLRGMRHLFGREMKGKIDYFISVDGTGLDVTSRAVGSHRYRVSYLGPGGHSYGRFGIPNPIHAMGRAIAKVADFQVPQSPKTTFNVGIVRGGTSVNSIAAEASMDVDLRSESARELDVLDGKFQSAIRSALDEENARWTGKGAETARLSLRVDTIGIRPTGAQADSALIVRTAVELGRALGFSPRTGASSTDANIPISLGIPAITIDGGGRGGGAHSPDEWYEDGERGWLGPQWAAAVVVGLAGGGD
ncbi:MAG TPA: M20/M25/M40 family metallo-hydrolase [Gemmatimonadaceae bacterium]